MLLTQKIMAIFIISIQHNTVLPAFPARLAKSCRGQERKAGQFSQATVSLLVRHVFQMQRTNWVALEDELLHPCAAWK